MEASAQLVVHAAFRHFAKGEQDHLERLFVFRGGVVAEQEVVHAGARKFRGSAKTAEARIEHAAEAVEGRNRVRLGRRRLSFPGLRRIVFSCSTTPAPDSSDSGAILFPGSGELLENRRGILACRSDCRAENRCLRRTVCDPA